MHTLVEEVLAALLHVVRVVELVGLEQQRVSVQEFAVLPPRWVPGRRNADRFEDAARPQLLDRVLFLKQERLGRAADGVSSVTSLTHV
jgi:hypothetical protein